MLNSYFLLFVFALKTTCNVCLNKWVAVFEFEFQTFLFHIKKKKKSKKSIKNVNFIGKLGKFYVDIRG